MEHRKIIAWGLIISIALAFLNAFIGDYDGLYQLSGLGMVVFGIWSAVVLLKNEQ